MNANRERRGCAYDALGDWLKRHGMIAGAVSSLNPAPGDWFMEKIAPGRRGVSERRSREPMQSLFPGKCRCCGKAFEKGSDIDYDRDSRMAYLPGHRPQADDEPDESMVELADRLGFRKADTE